MDYMTVTGTTTPEIEMKAIEYINVGYQAILTFECADGGFNWWEGDNPGNQILSAVGIMMLTDTKKVYDAVDTAVIQRTADYLAATQKSDGSWGEEKALHAGNENLGAGSLRATCYITWALAYGGFGDLPAVDKAVTHILSALKTEDGAYTKGLCANALLATGKGTNEAGKILDEFHASGIEEDGALHWTAGSDTLVNSYGSAADVEVTSLVALAMATKGSYPNDVNMAVEYLVRSKDPQGNWGYNTQATVLALKTFLKAATMTPGETDADISVLLDGKEMGSQHFDNFNKDVVWQLESPTDLSAGKHDIEIAYSGLGGLSYQIVTTHYVPWEDAELPEGPLTIDVSYDSQSVAVDDSVTCTVTVTNNDPDAKGMVLVTVGLPPGFALVTSDLAALQEAKTISNFEVTGKQLILYLDSVPAGSPTVIQYALVAQYPVKAETGGAEAKYYYDAETKAEDESQQIEVQD